MNSIWLREVETYNHAPIRKRQDFTPRNHHSSDTLYNRVCEKLSLKLGFKSEKKFAWIQGWYGVCSPQIWADGQTVQ
jgi:hypothetical protein